MNTVKIGLMGGGFMGKTHSNAFHTIPYIYYPRKFEIERTAICCLTIEEAKLSADRFGYAAAYDDYEKMIEESDFNAFDNAGPDPLHYPAVMKAIAHGKHIYCEKPISMTAAQAEEMYKAADAAGIVHMAGFNYRFFPANLLARKLIGEGAIGQIYHSRFLYDQHYGASDKLTADDIWYNNDGRADGVGQAIGCHVIDLARFLVGDIVSLAGRSKVYKPERSYRDGRTVKIQGEEGSYALVDFRNGATGTIESTQMASGATNNLHWEIYGSKGSMAFSLERPNYLSVFLEDTTVKEVAGFTDVSVTQSALGHPYADVWWAAGHNLGWEHGHIGALAHFCDCVANGTSVTPLGGTLYDGYISEKVIEAIKISSEQGIRIDIT
jgi:predicted dehydrogenase